MKNAPLPLALALMLATAGAAAADPEPGPRIVVAGEGEVSVAPDMAILSLSVLREAETARAALDADNEAMAAVVKAMKEAGIAERDLQTAGLSIEPRYVYPKSGEAPAEPKIDGYRAVNTLSVRVRDIGKVGAILDAAVTLGVNQGGGITFTNADTSVPMNEARKRAVADALARAKALAEAAGVRTGRVIEIADQSFAQPPRPMLQKARGFAASADAVPVEAGENSYRATVSVTLELEQ